MHSVQLQDLIPESTEHKIPASFHKLATIEKLVHERWLHLVEIVFPFGRVAEILESPKIFWRTENWKGAILPVSSVYTHPRSGVVEFKTPSDLAHIALGLTLLRWIAQGKNIEELESLYNTFARWSDIIFTSSDYRVLIPFEAENAQVPFVKIREV